MTEYKDLARILEVNYLKQDDLLCFQNGSNFITYGNKPIVFIDGFKIQDVIS